MRDRPQDAAARLDPRFERRNPPFTAGAVLAIALVVSVIGSYVSYVSARAAFAQHNAIERARDDLSTLLQLQTEQETALTGFLSTGQPVFLQPFDNDEPTEAGLYPVLAREIGALNNPDAATLLNELHQEHAQWWSQIAQPLIKNPNRPDFIERLEREKLLTDQFRSNYYLLANILNTQAQSTVEESFTLLKRSAWITAILILLFGAAALVADAYRSRSQAALAREKTVVDTLQRAFLSGWDVLANLRVGTAYLSSTREAAVGGDLFDVHRLDDRRTMLLVADVSGKGLSAAVETALVKYSIRTLAEAESDPGIVLERFNNTFMRSSGDPGAFVSVFLGILDDHDLTLRYASAGHSPVYIRSGRRVWPLSVTGGLIGLKRDDRFASSSVDLGVGDILVLATDGLTEARDAGGVMLGDDQAMRWIERANPAPQRLADEIVARLRRYGGGRITDDLALLVIRIQRAPEGAVPPEGAAPRRDVDPSRSGQTGAVP